MGWASCGQMSVQAGPLCNPSLPPSPPQTTYPFLSKLISGPVPRGMSRTIRGQAQASRVPNSSPQTPDIRKDDSNSSAGPGMS